MAIFKDRSTSLKVTICTLNQPLWMVIPPYGVTLPCPIHKGGHFITGSAVYMGV